MKGHDVVEAIERGWDRLSGGKLIIAAEEAGSDILFTTDQEHEQPTKSYKPKAGVRCTRQSAMADLAAPSPLVIAAVNAAAPGSYVEVEIPYD